MNREPEHDDELIDLGPASTETKGGPINLRVDEEGHFGAAGISDD
jgi:hypothetical protein